jgi:uncharacterized protein YacL
MAIDADKQSTGGKSAYHYLMPWALTLILLAACASSVLMGGLLITGVFEVGKGCLVYFGWYSLPAGILSREASTLHFAIRGIELLLLAPLAFLVLLSLARYIDSSRKSTVDERTRCDLLRVKALSVGLLIAVVAADLVGKILSHDGLSYTAAVSESLVIVVLGAYFFILEKLAREHP